MSESANDPPLYVPPAEPAPTGKLSTSTLLLGAGGILLLLSSFMPWIKVFTFAMSGVDTDWGILTIVAGVTALVAAAGPRVFASEKATDVALSLTGLLAAASIVAAIWVGFAIRDAVAEEETGSPASSTDSGLGAEFDDAMEGLAEAFKPTTGTGVYAAVLGGVVVLAGTVAANRGR